MGYKTLYDALPFLQNISEDRREQFLAYFESAPLWVLDSFQIIQLDKNEVFVREKEPANSIFFVGKGIIEAIDYRFYGIAYEFMRFDRVYAMGGMEFIMDLDTYCTTLRTVTKCTIVKMSRTDFEKWMHSDGKALKREAKLVGQYLLEDGRKGRSFLFLQGADRLAMLLVERYERYERNGILYVKDGQQNMANATGICLKTVNRTVKKFQEDGLITRVGNQIQIDESQYQALKKMVSKIMEAE